MKNNLCFTIASVLTIVFLLNVISATITVGTIPELSMTGNSFSFSVTSNEIENITITADPIIQGSQQITFTSTIIEITAENETKTATITYSVPSNFDFQFGKKYSTTMTLTGGVSGVVTKTISFAVNEDYCEVYDDFSSGVLNEEKWEEFSATDFPDEHFVENETYHVAQYFQRHREVQLIPKIEFYPGDEFEYNLIYNSGSGNQLSSIAPLGDDSSAIIENCPTPSPGCGGIGHINGDTAIGTQKGNYLVRYQFFDNYIILNFTRPDNTRIQFKMSNVNAPYKMSIWNVAGHNGLVHFDFDNFKICKEQQEPTLSDRISVLESWKNLIEDWKQQLAETLNQIAEKLDNHEDRITELEENSESKNYFKYLTPDQRKNIVCEYAKANNLTNYFDLGWNCTIYLRTSWRETTKICSCKVI